MGTGMKAISLWQPWATLWLLSDPEEKIFETRSWYTKYRGPLLVHAAKKQDEEILDTIYNSPIRTALVRHGLGGITELTFGAIIGQVDLIGCSRMDRMPQPSEREQSLGDWSPERFAWERGPKPVLFANPIPYRGSQGFFDVDPTLIQKSAT